MKVFQSCENDGKAVAMESRLRLEISPSAEIDPGTSNTASPFSTHVATRPPDDVLSPTKYL